ncbi:MAG: caspase family protein [Planctomycetes bacterium]|nr:caspase family protein [Planctomycetota bacterium]
MRLLLFIFTLTLLTACSSREFPSVLEDEELFRLHQNTQPMEYKVAIAPVSMAFDQEAFNRNTEEPIYSIPVDKDRFRREFEEAFREANVFESIGVLGRSDELQSDAHWLTEGWDNGYDLIFKFTVHKYQVGWVGHNGWFWPNTLLWGYLLPVSYFVGDEQYYADLEFEISVISIHSQRQVWTNRYHSRQTLDLDDLERGLGGWNIFIGHFTVPGSLDSDNWRNVNEGVMPASMLESKVTLLKDFYNAFNPFERTDEFRELVRKRLAVLVGVSKYFESKIESTIKFADKDAQLIHEHLTGNLPLYFPERNVVLLVNQRATRAAILDNLTNFLATRCLKYDDVIFFFAGYGATSPDGRNFIFPYDVKLSDIPNTAISIDELSNIFKGIKAEKKFLCFDTSFWGDLSERGYRAGSSERVSGRYFDAETGYEGFPPAHYGGAAVTSVETHGQNARATVSGGAAVPPVEYSGAFSGTLFEVTPEEGAPFPVPPPGQTPQTPSNPNAFWGEPVSRNNPWDDAFAGRRVSRPSQQTNQNPQVGQAQQGGRTPQEGQRPAPPRPQRPPGSSVSSQVENPNIPNQLSSLVDASTLVMLSCSAGEGATEVEEKSNGTFTLYFVEALRGAGDSNKNGVITIDEVYSYLFQRVREHAMLMNTMQTPRLYNTGGVPFTMHNPEG